MRADARVFLSYYLPVLPVVLFFLFASSITAFAQPQKPPRPLKVTVYNAQGLQFGAFAQTGTGGTVVISAAGGRSSSGSIILLNLGYTFSRAIYSIDAEPGSVVTIVNGSNSTLTGSGGGSNLTLALGSSTPASPFTIPLGTTPANPYIVYVGGTLTVPAGALPGNFTGMFSITFAQQ